MSVKLLLYLLLAKRLVFILITDCLIIPYHAPSAFKELGVLLDSKLYFHHHVDYEYISSQGLKMLGLIRYITSSISTPHSLSALYTTLVRPKLEYASVACNSITSTDSSKLKRDQIKFATLYHSRFCAGICGSKYKGMLSRLNISTLHSRRKHLDALFSY
jgi:hypothetical protein